jgi:hypothetical protein
MTMGWRAAAALEAKTAAAREAALSVFMLTIVKEMNSMC